MTQVLDHGEIELIAASASDLDVVNAARVSFHQFQSVMEEKDEGLIRFLIRNRHGTPFEHNFFKFRVKAPIFVFREWHRHRVGHSYNEWSARYSTLEPEFYIPAGKDVVVQTGKPGAYTFEPAPMAIRESFRHHLSRQSQAAYDSYMEAIDAGVAKQQARLFLPVNVYSEMIWSVNARSLMHFLGLRNSDQAQAEIREYAAAAEELFSKYMPVTHAAFVANGRVAP